MMSYKQPEYEEYIPPVVQQPISSQQSTPYITCPDVYMHVMNCPVCRKIYGQTTNANVYIVIIIILLVFCALLFKKAFP